jgi:hypothetical protein
LARLAAEFRQALDPGRLLQLATGLGLTTNSLRALGVGWSEAHRAWTFPMLDSAGRVLGIRLRLQGGRKLAVRGGREGLFLPPDLLRPDRDHLERLLICEGPTDTAALLDMGFADVAGRPSCTGGVRLLVDLVRARRPGDVVIVSDADEPGRVGATFLASALRVHVPQVRVVEPPAGTKDAREWLRRGGRAADVEQAVEAARPKTLTITTRRAR